MWIGLLVNQPQNNITGEVTTTVNVEREVQNGTCTINFEVGWNLISVACDRDNETISGMFFNISENYTLVQSYEADELYDPWKAHQKNLSSNYVQDVSSISAQRGYWVYVDNISRLEFDGTIDLLPFVDLYDNWNLAGFPKNGSRNITNITTNLNNTWGSIHLYNASDAADPWKVHNPSLPAFNDLDFLVPGYGFWINMTEARIWDLRE